MSSGRADLAARARSTTAIPLVVLLVLLLLGPLLIQPARAAEADRATAVAALNWLRQQQQPDGSFSAFGGPGDPGTTADAAFAFASAHIDPHHVRVPGGVDVVTYLSSHIDAVSADPGLAGKVALALYASGVAVEDPRLQALVAAIEAGYDAVTQQYGPSFYGHLYAVLALDTLGGALQVGAVERIYTAQTPEGSWGFTGDATSGTGDSNTTALAIQTLVAIDGERNLIWAGLDYLRSLQDDRGAVAYDNNFPPLTGDANSTALAVQAFLAAGEDPRTLPKGDLLEALLTFRNDSGAFHYQGAFPDDSLLATTQAVPALMLAVYPVPPVEVTNALADAAAPALPLAGCEFHAITAHNVCGLFADYWAANGGLAIFGYPLTEAVDFQGQRVQYFERARFEWHPENAGTQWEVLLTRLGADEVARVYADRTGSAEPRAECRFEGVTQHNICEPFVSIWDSLGGLPVFGYPLTEPFEENGMIVQYFERTRFEWQPGVWPDRMDVLFGRLGAEALERELAR